MQNQNKAVFIDRDGVINKNTHYVNCIEDFHILPGVKEALQLLKEAGFKIFIVTNQGGIEKGFLTYTDLTKIHVVMEKELPQIDDIAFCPEYNSFRRKPNPGMIYELANTHNIYLNESYMIGDMLTDCIAGRRAGCYTIQVMTNIMEAIKYANDKHIDSQVDSLLDAAKLILNREGWNI